MRRQLAGCLSKALKQMRCSMHGSKLGNLCRSARSVTSHVEEINKELAEIFGSPCADEPNVAADDARQGAIESTSTSSSRGSSAWSSSSTTSSEPAIISPANTLDSTAALHPIRQSIADVPEPQPALEQLHHCTAQLEEQVRAMSRILQELAQQQQQQQAPPAPPRRLRALQLQHQAINITIPADHTLSMSSQPSTPPATAPRPASFQQPVQQPLAPTSNRTPAASWASGGASNFSSSSSSSSSTAASAEEQQQQLTHVDSSGRASMVDVSGKHSSSRTASASCIVRLGRPAFDLVKHNAMAKGDVLTLAQVAGIQGAKQTSALIPLCHNIFLSKVDVQLQLLEAHAAVGIRATAKTVGATGVEMEALTAAAVAALTVYDMCKAVSKDIEIADLRLDYKEGGKSGTWARDGSSSSSSSNNYNSSM